MTYKEVLEQAKGCIGSYCKACEICNGKACRNQIPGPGAKGSGDTAIRNYDKWQEIRINMDTICENREPDTKLEIFGQSFRYPFFAGPVGAVNLHYGDKYDDLTYNKILVKSCKDNGIAAFTGDGTNPKVMEGSAQAIAAAGGIGVPTVKPWNLNTIKEKLELCRKAGCFAAAMDIDAAGVDGGIRNGTDVIKALALGADAVLICRPFVTAVYGGAEEGVKTLIEKIGSELSDTMSMCGAHDLKSITKDMIFHK